MHVNDLAEFLADGNGILECRKINGAMHITVTLSPPNTSEKIQSVGGDISSVVSSAMKAYARFIKYRDVVRIGGGRAKK